ncbi:WYL domain-containing protein [Actinobacteria bacterium YIM 96077]|uniref:WYL domain-containing protein n=2 Tax=Phytoactinopolyspora halophila TaxID=1981511 RepID=A0A329QZ45_9ACTN|nr:WYL domain-containing protein [Actinobacteria bacterium YIM 96077]RAW17670.1 WYL domain-containing protein [Phytoactinopolyspora halophila]
MNLVICLLVARGYVPKSRIRRIVGGYGGQTDEAFDRMFERDKEELREVGIPIETGSNDPFGEDEPGYRISRQEFELPEIRLEPDEAAVVGLAARMWQQSGLAEATSNAVAKLQAAGVSADTRALDVVEPRVGREEPAFWPLWEAVRDCRPVRFSYQKPSSASAERRHVQPWSVLSWHGRWYVLGFDVDRDDSRMFRLSRIVGDVEPAGPPGSYEMPPSDEVRAAAIGFSPPEPHDLPTATIRVRRGAGHTLRRHAVHVTPDDEPGWDVVTVTYSSLGRLAEEIAAHGVDAVAIEPEELRTRMVSWLSDVAGAAS